MRCLKALGVGLMTRKLGNKTTPVVSITEDDGLYKIKTESLVKTSEIQFRLVFLQKKSVQTFRSV
jgi:hypothetical protein